MSQRQMPQGIKTATELGPIGLFFGAYYLYDLYVATGVIIVTTLIGLAISYYYERKLPLMPVVTAVIVTIFGGLTLYLQDETFIKMKPTIIYFLFATALVAGLLLKKNFVQVIFGNVWKLDEDGWSKLTWRLVVFFLAMAVVNEIVWRQFSTELWVNIKVFGFTAATFVFFLMQMPLFKKHGLESDSES
ncbi:MAG: septation protein A [Sneathiella sp.]|nr:septation protein A [Sneathiella sp.]